MPAAVEGRPWTTIIRRFGTDGTIVAFCIVLLLVVILLPLPPFLLDLLIAGNFVFAVLLLLTSLLNTRPSGLSSFPTVLLLATLLRLAVNVSSTRLILLYGDQGLGVAGTVIRTFGELVVRGNFVVGAMIFGIIALVNFLVVAKGSARVAEVAARFVLDAVPGRQLAIDADVRSGRMTPEEAAAQRSEIGRESQFFGAMDGAMKFVQGDAIAGFLIVAVNALGGLGLGISRGQSWQDAVATFGVLAIGDGLVNCLPSLLTSLAAGFIVTHVHDQRMQSSGGQVFSQFLEDSRVLGLAAAAFFLFSVLPGFPTVPFAGMGIGLLLLLWYSRAIASPQALPILDAQPVDQTLLPEGGSARDGRPPAIAQGGMVRELLPYSGNADYEVQALEIELDAATFQGRWDLSQPSTAEGALFHRFISAQREAIYRDSGVWVPEIGIRFAPDLAPAGYRIRLREHSVRSGVLRPGEFFVAVGAPVLAIFGGRPTQIVRHPSDHALSCWIEPNRSLTQALERLGVAILEPVEFLAFDALAVTRQHLADLLGIDDLKREMKLLQQRFPGLCEEVLERGIVTIPELTEVFRRLLREQVSIRDSKAILEGISEYAATTPVAKDRGIWLADLHLHLRRVCTRGISSQAAGPGGRTRAFLLSPAVEEEFRTAVDVWDASKGKPPLEPGFDERLRDTSRLMFLPALDRGALPVVVLCASEVRLAVNDFLSRLFPSVGWFRTISYEELQEHVQPDVVGVLSC